MGFFGAYLDTVGIEFEGGLPREFVMEFLLSKMGQELAQHKITVTRDASTEFYADYIKVGRGNYKFSAHTLPATKMQGFGGNRTTMGYEIFTAPLPMNELETIVHRLVNNLTIMGDFNSSRNSTHFHIGFGNNLRILKNMLRISMTLDPVLYRLGGMGRVFRGSANLSAYARPLMNSACVFVVDKNSGHVDPLSLLNAPVEHDEDENEEEIVQELPKKGETLTGKFAQIINPLRAVEATTLESFWASFGINYPQGGTSKYHASRYSGTNYFAVPAHNTIEFRHFNQSGDAFLIIALAKFLRATVELATLLDKNEILQFEPINPNVEISVGDATDVISRILSMCYSKEIDMLPNDREIGILYENLSDSSVLPLPEMPVLTHSKENSISRELVEKGGLILHNKVLAPQHVDIHNIKLVNIFD